MLKALMKKHNIKGRHVADALNINPTSIYLILQEKARITVPLALRIGKLFDVKPESLIMVQMRYDIDMAKKDKALSKALSTISKITATAKAKGKPVKAAKKTASPRAKKPAGRKKAAAK